MGLVDLVSPFRVYVFPAEGGNKERKQRPTELFAIAASSCSPCLDGVHILQRSKGLWLTGCVQSNCEKCIQNGLIYLNSHARSWTWIKSFFFFFFSFSFFKVKIAKKQRSGTWNSSDVFLEDHSQEIYCPSVVARHRYEHIGRHVMLCEWFVCMGMLKQLPAKWQWSICMLSSQGSTVWMPLLSAQEEQYSRSSFSGHNDLLFIGGSWKPKLSNCQKEASFH